MTKGSMKRDEWETAVAEALSNKLECDYSDATGMMEVPMVAVKLFQLWNEGVWPEVAAAWVDEFGSEGPY